MTDLTIQNGEVNLAASVYGPEDAPNVLCLHGITVSRDTWDETVERLQHGYRVWTLDFRGHGHSDRAESYRRADYLSDAEAALDFIAKPTVVIGHSLGANVATILAQTPHPVLTAVLLEDPAIYLGVEEEFNKTFLAQAFPIVQKAQAKMLTRNAPLADWVAHCGNTPDHRGGVASDHYDSRHILSFGSALQRFDPDCWIPVVDLSGFDGLDPDLPLQLPVTVLRADSRYGPTFLPEHQARFLASNPHAEILEMEGSSHSIHSSMATQPRFLDIAEEFVQRHAKPPV